MRHVVRRRLAVGAGVILLVLVAALLIGLSEDRSLEERQQQGAVTR